MRRLAQLGYGVVMLSVGFLAAESAMPFEANGESEDKPEFAPRMDAMSHEDAPEYLGTKKCRSCHSRWYDAWAGTPKGRSWEALLPGKGVKVKQRAGLDPERDYRSDARCLPCHSVGFGHDSGYAIPPSESGKEARFARNRQGVGCESCHGPGGDFVEIMRDIRGRKRSYDPAELHAAGLRRMSREVCLACHDLKAMCIVTDGHGGTHPVGALEVTLKDRSGFHAAIPLKYRRADQD